MIQKLTVGQLTMDVGTIDVMVAQYLRERGHSVAFLAMLDDETNVTDAAVSS